MKIGYLPKIVLRMTIQLSILNSAKNHPLYITRQHSFDFFVVVSYFNVYCCEEVSGIDGIGITHHRSNLYTNVVSLFWVKLLHVSALSVFAHRFASISPECVVNFAEGFYI